MTRTLRRPAPSAFDLLSQRIGALPILNAYLERLQVKTFLEKHLDPAHPRSRVAPARVLLVLLRNLALTRTPLYSLSEWAANRPAAALGLSPEEKASLNDDRMGRALDELFDCDRQALLTDLVLHLVREFDIDLSQLHNDSTSLTFQGFYPQADGRRTRGQPTPRIAFGYNKDHRPDLKQLLWILTIAADGAVPVCFKVTDGNVEDSSTHLETWTVLNRLAGRPDFLYIADSKLCVTEVMRHIDGQGGRFLAPLPRCRKEDGRFREWLCRHSASWEPAGTLQRIGKPADPIQALESPIAEASGFRLVWFLSADKRDQDIHKRQDALDRAFLQLEAFQRKLQGPKCRFKKRSMVARTVEAILRETGTGRWIDYEIQRENQVVQREMSTAQPGRATRLRTSYRTRFILRWAPNLERIREDSKADGISPFVTNDRALAPAALYQAYHSKQALLEKRHHLLKNVLRVTPAYLHSISRLDAFLLLEYLALTLHALIERDLRRAMEASRTQTLPLYPEGRNCKAPTAARLFEIFENLESHTLFFNGAPIRSFPPVLSPLQQQALMLLSLSESLYLTPCL